MTTEILRLIENLIKQGTVADCNPAAGRVRVRHGGLTTDWLPYFVPASGGVSVHRPPSVGENCLVLSPSGEPANGIVLCGLASSQHQQPGSSADDTIIRFPDGATAQYNHAAGHLDLSGIKTVAVQADTSLTVDCPANTFTGAVTVQGPLTYLAGLTGGNSTGGSAAVIRGDITHEDGKLSSNGIVLHTHTHPENGNRTSAPS